MDTHYWIFRAIRAAEVVMSWQVPGYRHRLDLGGGATGRAVLALSEDSGELAVIKYLHVEPDYIDQVREEVATLVTLDEQHFVHIREFVESGDGSAALILDPINGVSLRMLLRDHGALGPEAALLLYRDARAGFAVAHEAGVLHGDYRPENVLVDGAGASV